MRSLLSTASIVLLLAGASPAAAASIQLQIDHSERLTIAGSAASVLVGNPAVADVTVVDSHTLYVSGRGFGLTDVVVLDREGQPLYTADVTVAPPTSNIAVYRGAERQDFACAPSCQVTIRSGTGANAGATNSGGSGSNSAGASSGGGLTGAIGSLANGALGGGGGGGNGAGNGGSNGGSQPIPPPS